MYNKALTQLRVIMSCCRARSDIVEVVYADSRCMDRVEEFLKAAELGINSWQCPDQLTPTPR